MQETQQCCVSTSNVNNLDEMIVAQNVKQKKRRLIADAFAFLQSQILDRTNAKPYCCTLTAGFSPAEPLTVVARAAKKLWS